MVEKKLNKYYWISGVFVVTLLVIILASVFAIVPSFKSINKTGEELKNKKEDLRVAEEKLEKLKELKVKEDELREQSRVVYRAIPSKKEVGDIFIQLDKLVIEAGGTSDGISSNSSSSASSSGTSDTSSAQVSSGLSELTYSINATFPSYQSFKSLLSASENALRFVHLTNFSISNTDSFSVDLTYTAYYRNEQVVSSEVEIPGVKQ